MSGFWSSAGRRSSRIHAVGLAISIVAIASLLAIESLHDHACTGDGCMLCLAAAWAHVLLGFCIGIAVTLSVLHAVRVIRLLQSAMLPRLAPRVAAVFSDCGLRRVQTPVTLEVKLLI